MARSKEFNRESVLDKAMNVFWHRGYEATSIQDLVDNLGINRQSMYDTFGDKHTLFLAALKHYEEVKGVEMVETLERPGSGLTAIKQMFAALVQEVSGDAQHRGCLMVNTAIELAPHDSVIAVQVARNVRQGEDAFYRTLCRAQEQGELRTQRADLRALARFLMNAVQGLKVMAKVNPTATSLQDIVDVTLSVLA